MSEGYRAETTTENRQTPQGGSGTAPPKKVIPYEWDVQKVKLEARLELLTYLIGVAEKTEGAEVWRALFAEMWGNTIS